MAEAGAETMEKVAKTRRVAEGALRKTTLKRKIELAYEDSGHVVDQEQNFLDPDEAEFEGFEPGTVWPPTDVTATIPAGCSADLVSRGGRNYLRLVSGPLASYPVVYYPFGDWAQRGAVAGFAHLFSLVAVSESGDAEMTLYAQAASSTGGAGAETIAEGEPVLVAFGDEPARPSVGPYDVDPSLPYLRFPIEVSDESTILVSMQQQEKAKKVRGKNRRHKRPGTYKPPSHKAGSIKSRHVKNRAITGAKAALLSMLAENLATDSVTEPKIATDSVSEAKIPTGHVRTRHHLAGNVDSSAIGAAQVIAAKLGSQSVGSGALGLLAVLGGHVAGAQLTDTHFPQWNLTDIGTWGTGLNTFTVRPNAIWDPHLLDNTLTDRGHNPNQRGGPAGAFALRKLDGTTNSAQPFCSTPLMLYPEEERLSRLETRRRVREAPPVQSGFNRQNFEALVEAVESLKGFVLELSNLLMDYRNIPRDMTGDEREEWIKGDDPEAREYRANLLAHEYPEEHKAHWERVHEESKRHQERVLADQQVLVEKGQAEYAKQQKKDMEKARIELVAHHAADAANQAALRQRVFIEDLKRGAKRDAEQRALAAAASNSG